MPVYASTRSVNNTLAPLSLVSVCVQASLPGIELFPNMRKGDSAGPLKGLIREVTERGAEPVFEGYRKNNNMMDPESSVHPAAYCSTCTRTWCGLLRHAMLLYPTYIHTIHYIPNYTTPLPR
jgi:hypothetical protein